MVKDVSKEWYKSKTLIVGALQFVGGLLLALGDQVATGGAFTFSGLATIALRLITKTELK